MRRMIALCLIFLLLCGCGQTAAPSPAEEKQYLLSTTIEGTREKQPYVNTMEYHYDENGFLNETVTILNGEEAGRSSFECDEKGNPTKETHVSGSDTTIIESALTYGSQDNLVTKVDTVTKSGIVQEVREYHFVPGTDKPSNILRYKGTEVEPYITITYTYNDLGQEIRWVAEGSGHTTQLDAEYDEEGRLLTSVQSDEDGNVISRREYSYEGGDTICVVMDGKNNVQSITTFKDYEEGNTKIQEVYVGDRLMTRTANTYSPTLP